MFTYDKNRHFNSRLASPIFETGEPSEKINTPIYYENMYSKQLFRSSSTYVCGGDVSF